MAYEVINSKTNDIDPWLTSLPELTPPKSISKRNSNTETNKPFILEYISVALKKLVILTLALAIFLCILTIVFLEKDQIITSVNDAKQLYQTYVR